MTGRTISDYPITSPRSSAVGAWASSTAPSWARAGGWSNGFAVMAPGAVKVERSASRGSAGLFVGWKHAASWAPVRLNTILDG